jgi:hypothetical protein
MENGLNVLRYYLRSAAVQYLFTEFVCPTALLTQYTQTNLFEILSGHFLRIFPWEGAFFEKGPFCEIIYKWGIAMWLTYHAYSLGGLGAYSPRKCLKFEARKCNF